MILLAIVYVVLSGFAARSGRLDVAGYLVALAIFLVLVEEAAA